MTADDQTSKTVTMRDVARAAGVSHMTVSRALKKDSPVAKETRDHILRVVREMNYVPDQLAGSLTTRKTGFVAVLVPSLNNLHFAETVQALTEELERNGLQILLGHTDYSAEREEQIVETMLRRRPEAIILQCGADAVEEDPLSRLSMSTMGCRAMSKSKPRSAPCRHSRHPIARPLSRSFISSPAPRDASGRPRS